MYYESFIHNLSNQTISSFLFLLAYLMSGGTKSVDTAPTAPTTPAAMNMPVSPIVSYRMSTWSQIL